MIAVYIYLAIVFALMFWSLRDTGSVFNSWESFCTVVGLCLLWPVTLVLEFRSWLDVRKRYGR